MMPRFDRLELPEQQQTTKLFSRNGELLGEIFEEERRELVGFDEIPRELLWAVISIEDKKFFEHPGIDVKGIIRALKANLSASRKAQGASTITQQLVRNLFLTKEKSYRRKLMEMILAMKIEKQYSKQDIVRFYLNLIPFGHGAAGVKAASEVYFGKNLDELTLSECAILAGLPQAPSRNNPISNPEKCRDRRNMVLREMRRDSNRIPYELTFDGWKGPTQEDYEAALNEEIDTSSGSQKRGLLSYKYPYYTAWAVQLLEEELGHKRVYGGGLEVHLAIDTKVQQAAKEELDRWLQEFNTDEWQSDHGRRGHDPIQIDQGAIVVVDNHTYEVLALVGGKDFTLDDQFNRATQALRQPGSSFKPFVYYQALKNGYWPESLVIDEEKTYVLWEDERYTPHNYDGKFLGVMPLREALVKSRNTVAVKLIDRFTPHAVVEDAYKCGITSRLEPTLSLALGTSVVTPFEMAQAYSTIANYGNYRELQMILEVVDSEGRRIALARREPQEVLNESKVRVLVDMMHGVTQAGGTGYWAGHTRDPKTGAVITTQYELAGKTGTTSDLDQSEREEHKTAHHRDAWFNGFSPDYTCVVWVGNDQNKPLGWNVTGGGYPARIWGTLMKRLMEGKERVEFARPPNSPAFVRSLEDEYTQEELSIMLEIQRLEEELEQQDIREPERGEPEKEKEDSETENVFHF
jgi:penicillin-binding protein 1A